MTGRRSEVLIGVREPQEDQQGDVLTVVTNRQVIGASGKAGKADVSDLTFNVIAKRGTGANAVIDPKGLVQVVLVHATEDRVIEKISGTKLIESLDSGGSNDWGGRSLRYDDLGVGTRGATKGIGASDTITGVGSTLRGETDFSNTRRRKVSIEGITGVTPLAEFNLALVGNGGPITAEMTEARMPQA